MEKATREKKQSLLRSVEERAMAKRTEEEKRNQKSIDLIPYLPKDCVSRILLWLPLDSLHTSRFVCKSWYHIINDPKFIDDHLRRSETVLLFLSRRNRNLRRGFESSASLRLAEKPNSFSVEAQLNKLSLSIFRGESLARWAFKFDVKFLEIGNGNCRVGEYNVSCLGGIRASCDGLILLDNEINGGGVVIMNPVTRKLMAIPIGTVCDKQDECYGLAFCQTIHGYKIVHLFRDYLGYANCEILSVGSRFWRPIDGPSLGPLRRFLHSPVLALEALHWLPQLDRYNYVWSMGVKSEKFQRISLPKSGGLCDGIVELNGCLAFVTHEGDDRIDVWILKGLSGEAWTKQHSIVRGCEADMVPLAGFRIGGEMGFKRGNDGSIYVCDFRFGELNKVEMGKECVSLSVAYCSHVNSLVCW